MAVPCNEKGDIPVWAVPKSSADKIEGWVQDASGQRWLKVRLSAAPEDGKANKALLKLLAREWGVPRATLSLLSGETSRHKKIRYTA